jgi:hypothetical protein
VQVECESWSCHSANENTLIAARRPPHRTRARTPMCFALHYPMFAAVPAIDTGAPNYQSGKVAHRTAHGG